MKGWLLKTLAGLLTLSLCGAIVLTTLNHTILSAQYLESKFAAINGYNRLSSALSNDVVKQSGLPDSSQVTSTINGIVTPTVVRQRVNTAIDGLQQYLQGKSSAPTIDFSDLGAQAQAAGVPLGQDSNLLHPVTLGPTTAATGRISLNPSSTSKITVAASAILAVIVLALSLLWRRYTVLPSVLISVGVFMGIIALVAYFALGDVSHYFTFSGGQDSFATLGRDFAQEIGKDLGRRFGIIAASCLAVGIVARILTGRLQKMSTATQIPAPMPLPTTPYQPPTNNGPTVL